MISDRRIRTSLVAIGADCLLTAMKAFLAIITGSQALLADAYHSLSDFIVSILLLLGIVIRHYAEKHQDETKTLRARRLESLLAVVVAASILYVPVEIISNTYDQQETAIRNLGWGISGTLVIIALVFFMAKLKTHVGKETDSPALEADGYHSMVDVFSSVAVLFSLVGLMVGINIDEFVALLIAAMIGYSGVELLLSGLKSLTKGTEFDQLSLGDILRTLFFRTTNSKAIFNTVENTTRIILKHRYNVLGLVLIAYGLSGFTSVPLGHTGIQYHFNKAQSDALSPGLHYHWPAPFGRISLIETGTVEAITLGSRIEISTTEDGATLWRELKESRVLSDDVEYLVTANENLIDLTLTLQYRLSNAATSYQQFDQSQKVIARFAEAALWKTVAQFRYDDIISQRSISFSAAVEKQLLKSLATVHLPIDIIHTNIVAAQPPAMVVGAYRDVLTADQEQNQRVNRAEAEQLNDLPLARAKAHQEITEAYSSALEIELRALGEVERISSLASIYQQYPDAFEFNQHITTLENVLKDKSLIITDPKVNPRELQVWQTQP
ncbi:cation diffusion facilitator family transporter [Marinibactrum halimedae]|uniref:Band 7 domain-containing protein n=1 Tax=Marinibactrum halimedae TaxID=1444977 RepID=A0AA37T8Q6_9GAMM|nr:cation diffusion facilitator family transporter [Marinibactrum halimedae]MCD9457425.1 cation diffusion facilitator family transporter [Marinibactrum halimedae]GLS25525.1 hypothetical protein GCM10007877_12390 [Marinibactrum halimedae]